jgi:hypothetical protein
MNQDLPRKFYGKYRGTVLSNEDPKKIGRLLVQVPDVFGLAASTWAMPCVPMTSAQAGMFVLPTRLAGVWVEFEQGNPQYPIWVGGFWGSFAEVPVTALRNAPTAPNVVLQTVGQNSITIFGAPGGGIALSCGPVTNPKRPQIVITPTGILITNGTASISLTGSTVSINQGALTVT